MKSQISADIFLYNAGYIANPFKDYKGIITPDEYIDSIDIKTENPDILEYFRSKKYKNIIPVFGYYILKSGVKVSVHEFINDFAIKELEKVKPDKYHAIYEDTVFKECKRSEEEEAQFTFETINKRYQALNKIITNLLHLRVFNGKKETNIVGAYSRDLVSSMETVVNICNGDEEFFKEFGSAPYDSSQILFYDELKRVAIVLSSDETFNPNKINYYNKLIKNAKFIKLGKDIEKYVKMSNEKGGKKK